MGIRNIALLIIGVIVVGISVAVDLSMFGGQSTEENKNGVTSGLLRISAVAFQFKLRPASLGGGGGLSVTYSGWSSIMKTVHVLITTSRDHPIVG